MRVEISLAMISLTVTQMVKAIPSKPGVYLYKDDAGHLLYVGKAKNLKNRVSSYFHERAMHSPRIQALVEQIAHIDYVVTSSEVEALILEANLIKSQRPKYNILMRDDKKYPWLVLTDEPFPRLIVSREPVKTGKAKRFGPYASPGALYQTLQLIKKVFPLRQRKTPLFKDRPCMNYHIGSCLGPCQSRITPEDYQRIVHQLELFLKGQADDLLALLQREMEEASENLDFEKAAQLRDRFLAAQTMLQRQSVMYADEAIHQDIVGIACSEQTAYIALLKVRRGRLIQTLFFDMALENGEVPPEEAYASFLLQYYTGDTIDRSDLPAEILLHYPIADQELLAQSVAAQKRGKVALTIPHRNRAKREILEMAVKNAEESRERARIDQETRLRSDPAQALILLQECLDLPAVPRRIECYDISHIGGTNTVASMVVFTDGVPDRKEYRRFRIRTVAEGKPDDFQSMLEVLTRRFSKRDEKNWPDPDLIIVDGGKGQLSSALKALHALGIWEQPIISLAKKFEEVYLPHQSRPVLIERESMALLLLQKIRDEAHRFAVTYHRHLRQREQTRSFLDEVPGIGRVRKQHLLQHFDSADAIRKASLEEIAEATGTRGKTAEVLYRKLQESLSLS